MKKQEIVFWSDSNKRFFTNLPITCHICKEEVYGLGIFIKEITSKKLTVYKFHSQCALSFKSIGRIIEGFQVMCVNDLPDDALPILLQHSGLSSFKGNMSVFEAALKEERGVKIVDRTKLANRSDQAAKIEYEKNREITKKRIKELDSPVDDFDEYIKKVI